MRVVASFCLILVLVASTVSAFDAYKLLLGELTETATCDVGRDGGRAPNVNFTAYELIDADKKMTNYSVSINPCAPAVSECGSSIVGGSYVTLAAAAKGGRCASFSTEKSSTYDNSTLTIVYATADDSAEATLVIWCDPTATEGLTFVEGNYTSSTGAAHLSFKSTVPCTPAVPTPSPATPAPTDGGSDGGKLSTGAVVGIIAGSAVVVVSLGVAITKFRASSTSTDGTYTRV